MSLLKWFFFLVKEVTCGKRTEIKNMSCTISYQRLLFFLVSKINVLDI
jgi:hypothetical protein